MNVPGKEEFTVFHTGLEAKGKTGSETGLIWLDDFHRIAQHNHVNFLTHKN